MMVMMITITKFLHYNEFYNIIIFIVMKMILMISMMYMMTIIINNYWYNNNNYYFSIVDRYTRELVDHVEQEDDRWQHTASLIIDLETVSTQWISRGLLDIILNSNYDHNDNSSSSSSGSSSNSSSNNNNNDILKLGNNNDHIQISPNSNSSSSNSIIFNNNYQSIYNLREEAVYMNIIAILPVIMEWMNVQPMENGVLRQSSSLIKPKVLITSPSSSSTTTTSITFMSTYFPTFYLINNMIDGLNNVPISLHLPLHRLLSKIILFGAYGDANLSRVLDYFHSLTVGILCNFIGTC